MTDAGLGAIPTVDLDRARRLLAGDGPLAVLTGAGMSAESGVPTFRDAQTGLWARFDPSELATPEAWSHDRDTVWAWYRWRQHLVSGSQPNPGHEALAALARTGRRVEIITQNVDDLHERAGNHEVHHLHGSLLRHRCDSCGAGSVIGPPPSGQLSQLTPPRCRDCAGHIRPDIVWFGEPLPAREWDSASTALAEASALLVVGTSGLVHPAASLPSIAARSGIPVIEVNPGHSGLGAAVTIHLRGPAGSILPALFPS